MRHECAKAMCVGEECERPEHVCERWGGGSEHRTFCLGEWGDGMARAPRLLLATSVSGGGGARRRELRGRGRGGGGLGKEWSNTGVGGGVR